MSSPSPPVACSSPDTGKAVLLDALRRIVGRRHVLVGDAATRRFRRGYRFGEGPVLAVLRPGTLVQQWRVLQALVRADVVIVMQAANTGLTGGSTPDGSYDRPVVIVNTMRLRGVQLIDDGRQAVCLPGSTLDQLERMLAPLGREPHSVIGSSCLGASVLGGVCNNSGGSLVQRGPAYTEMALFARLDEHGRLALVNHLGIQLGDDPETVLDRLQQGAYATADIRTDAGHGADHDYVTHVRQVDADTPARFNADPRRLHEASGSAGRLAVFAVRLDTFPSETRTRVFYIGSNDTAELTAIRRHMLGQFRHLPVAAEYMHRDAFDMADRYGKDSFLAIRWLGTHRLPRFFALKSRVDALCERLGLPATLTDRMLQRLGRLFPDHLPPRMRDFRRRYEHHLLLKMAGDGIEEAEAWLARRLTPERGAYLSCSPDEGAKAFLHRFVTAGAAVRYRAIHPRQVEDIVALDIALRRNDLDWFEQLPADLETPLLARLYYGHFFCHVMHQDYIVHKGHDCRAIEERMHERLDRRGARYPAEHNVGHHYHAGVEQTAFFRQLDPSNTFNPGIGLTSRKRHWAE